MEMSNHRYKIGTRVEVFIAGENRQGTVINIVEDIWPLVVEFDDLETIHSVSLCEARILDRGKDE